MKRLDCPRMNLRRAFRPLLVIYVLLVGIGHSRGGTNGFVVPSFRGSANTEAGYWENFSVPFGPPGNSADVPGATTDALLIQSNTNALITGSGNLYNPSGVSAFTIVDSTVFTLGTVVLQVRTLGSEIDYNSVSLVYSNDSGTHSLAPLFRHELNRAGMPGQGYNVSSLWQWDLSGLNITNFSINIVAAGPSLSFDSLTLDNAAQFSPAFPEQPFRISAIASLARWMYPFNGDPGGRPTASAFGSLGSNPEFDSRDAQYLLGFNTTNRIPAGAGAKNYAIRRARLTLTISSGNQYIYTGTLRDYRSYFPTNDPRYISPETQHTPVELFGAGFRGGFTNSESTFVPYAATNYPQDGPFYVVQGGGNHSNRVAYAAGFDTHGVLVDVSNNVGDDGTNEIANPFEVAPFAVGQTTNVASGQLMPLRSQLTFEFNLEDPLIYQYVQNGLNDGNLSFVATSFTKASLGGPPTYPNFYTIFAPVATNYFPSLEIEGEVIRPGVDSDNDGLADDWENFHFGTLLGDASSDADRDGLSNRAEQQAGTIPVSHANSLRIISIERDASSVEIHFAYAANRQYTVQSSSDLLSWPISTGTLFYSSAWLGKSTPNPSYPSPVFAGWREAAGSNPWRFYRVEAH